MLSNQQNTPINKRWGLFFIVGCSQPKGGKMDLISALKELEKTSVGTGFACSVDTALKAMNKDEQEAFQSALNNKAVASTALWDLLNSNGYKVGKETIYKHRRKGCRCFK